MTKENRLFCKIQSTFALARRKPSLATFFGIAVSDIRVVKQRLVLLKIGTEKKYLSVSYTAVMPVECPNHLEMRL
jgi:hypothetical protein